MTCGRRLIRFLIGGENLIVLLLGGLDLLRSAPMRQPQTALALYDTRVGCRRAVRRGRTGCPCGTGRRRPRSAPGRARPRRGRSCARCAGLGHLSEA
jgi:hypothetical protein